MECHIASVHVIRRVVIQAGKEVIPDFNVMGDKTLKKNAIAEPTETLDGSRPSRITGVAKLNAHTEYKDSEIPDADAMDIIARNIGRDWKALGRRLGLTDGELYNVKTDYQIEGQHEIVYQMIRMWKESAYPTELRTLAEACTKIRRRDVADMLTNHKGDNET